jgi:hypothetical protein
MLRAAMAQPKISNDYVAAGVALLATLAVLYIIGGLANPQLFGIKKEADVSADKQTK